MIEATVQRDNQLRSQLEALTTSDRDYWSFNGNSCREHGHGLFQYPAMMVPQMIRSILEEACVVHPEIERVGDPFAGSGTILTESMLRGLSFIGTDINPLAILLCGTKAGPFFSKALKEKISKAKNHINADRRSAVEVDFPNRDKWFRPDVQIGLSKIRRAITQERAPWARRFFWIGLAETVRLTSNSRTSTVKLHIRPKEEIKTKDFDPINVFEKIIDRNFHHLKTLGRHLKQAGLVSRGHYIGTIDITLSDSRQTDHDKQSDIIVTSPPYGDNATTVPYGQHSYLPLQWINFGDIDQNADEGCLRSTHEIDTRSLGGSKRIESAERDALCERSQTLSNYLTCIEDQPADRTNRVIAFFRDLDACIGPILRNLRSGGLMIWILGNRQVGNKRVPLDTIVSELSSSHRTFLLCKLARRISSKRMAFRNNIADTMSAENILVMRKALKHGEEK